MVLITKSKTPTSTVLVVERQADNNNEHNEKNEYLAGGEHSGIVISKIGKYGKIIYTYMCRELKKNIYKTIVRHNRCSRRNT